MATTQSAIVLPPLPYANDALEPYMSGETLDYHYGKHHKGYVEKVNSLISGTEFGDASLEESGRRVQRRDLQRCRAGVESHLLLELPVTAAPEPGEGSEPGAREPRRVRGVPEAIRPVASGLFGSGWTWLVKDGRGALRIMTTSNANTPVREGAVALLTCDMWEHAYYIDHRNDRAAYLENFWPLVNWEFVSANLAA